MGPKTLELKRLCAKLGRRYVGFRGDPHAPIWLIGEAPGADEDQLGVPFVGYSGRELDKMLSEARISLSECCFTNPYKVRPPDNDIARIEETGIAKQLFEEQFFEELREFNPPFIVALGGTALSLVCPSTVDRRDHESKISKWRGSLLESELLQWPHYVVPNFHPAYILREWSDRDVAVFILRRVKEEFDYWRANSRHQPLPGRELIVNASFDETKEFLNELLGLSVANRPTSVDIELLARRVPLCIALSNNRSRAISIEFFNENFKPNETATIWRLLDKILSTKRIVGQNYTTFDANWLNALGFSVDISLVEDTLVRHHVLYPEMSHKLDFQVMQYTRQPFYKDEGKGWTVREGLPRLKRYNCLDAACTLEVYEEQEKDFEEKSELRSFFENYEMPLARAFFEIDKRGIQTNSDAVVELRKEVVQELGERCVEISSHLGGRAVAFSAKMALELCKQLGVDEDKVLNIGSVPQLKRLLTDELKIRLKIDRKSHKESTGEDSLNEAFAATSNPVLKNILRTRELNKILGTYINARRDRGVFYSCYSVTGTVTGRRASRKNFLGYGSNGQNQPKHSDLGKKFRSVFVARPDKCFVACDQVQAEDWIVQGIIADVAGVTKGIEELRAGVDRHQRLAAQIFGLPLAKCDKDSMERYLGKKTRHAGHYGMEADKMSTEMAKEGFSIDRKFCAAILEKFHEYEPHIRRTFHKWIENEVSKKRVLTTPLGRSREFYGLRPFGDNGKIFREAYAYIPQSTVGDNTGLAILFCEKEHPEFILQDGHDALLGEVDDNVDAVVKAVHLLCRAFDRTLRFQNGFELKIPIEFEIGYSLAPKEMLKCPASCDEAGLMSIYDSLKEQRSLRRSTTGGVPSLESLPVSRDMSGSIEDTKLEDTDSIPISLQYSSEDPALAKEQR